MYELEFPTLEFIKAHKRHPDKKDPERFREYEWYIFTIGKAYCRIKYNEDDNGKIFLDMMQEGYVDHFVPQGFNKAYPATTKGYEELKKVCTGVYNKLINEIIFSNSIAKLYWE